MLEARPGAFIFIGNGDSAGPASPGLRLQRRGDPGRRLVLGAAGRDRDAGLSVYWSASLCPSNTVGWQVWLAAASAAHSRAAMLAFGSGPAISRSSIAPGFWPSRTAMIGRRPSNSAGWLDFSVVHSARNPSIEALRADVDAELGSGRDGLRGRRRCRSRDARRRRGTDCRGVGGRLRQVAAAVAGQRRCAAMLGAGG